MNIKKKRKVSSKQVRVAFLLLIVLGVIFISSFALAESSIELNEKPADVTTDSTPHFAGNTSDEANVSYKIDQSNWSLVCNNCTNFTFNTSSLTSGFHNLTLAASFYLKNSTNDTNDTIKKKVNYSFKVADGSEITFEVGADHSYPDSSIPIDPDSSVYPKSTDIDFNFTLGGSDISNNVGDGICDFYGDPGWGLGGDKYCEASVTVSPGTYELKAKWNLDGHHEIVIDPSYKIKSGDKIWWEKNDIGGGKMNHGGRVETFVDYNLAFSKDYDVPSGVTCKGSEVKVKGIQEVVSHCSNGVTRDFTPPFFAWVYKKEGGTEEFRGRQDNTAGDNCKLRDVSRLQFFESTRGYKPKNCDIDWSNFWDNKKEKFSVFDLDQPGKYTIYIDYVNAVSDSPQDFICPGSPREKSNKMCKRGSMSSDWWGWENKDKLDLKVAEYDNSVDGDFISATMSGNDVELNPKFDSADDLDKNYTVNFEFENTGTGNIEIKDFSLNCPSDVDCWTTTSTSGGLLVEEGDDVDLSGKFNMPKTPDSRILELEVNYDDSYGLGCLSESTVTKEFNVSWDDNLSPEAYIRINQADNYTNTSVVNLSLYAEDSLTAIDQYWLANESESNFGSAEGICPSNYWSRDWSLKDEDGNRTVFFQVDDVMDNQAIVNDTIFLDTKDPLIDCNLDCARKKGPDIVFSPNVTDPGSHPSGIDKVEIKKANGEYCNYSGSEKNCSIGIEETFGKCIADAPQKKKFFVVAYDKAGNKKRKGPFKFDVKRMATCPCSYDMQCYSGNCFKGCRGTLENPSIIIQ